MSPKKLIYPIFLPMLGCTHRCIYCDQRKISAAGNPDLDKEFQNAASFVAYHGGEDKEIAFYGGSFTALSSDFRAQLMGRFSSLRDSQTIFRISTHPLYINEPILHECQEQGIGCIELGIQDFSSKVLSESGRGYSSSQAISAAWMVKNHGFKLGIQLLPGLPGSNKQSIAENQAVLCEIKPDYLRLYPLIVIKDTALAKSYAEGSYQPLSLEEAVNICADFAELAEREGISIIKMGLPSTLALSDIVAGPYHPAFGEFVMAERLIRSIVNAKIGGKQINLDKKQQTLILSHRGIFKQNLEKRLKNCTINSVDML
jgi:histone acetyltransferase (RNA polymerase elongator complex component)